MLNKFKISLFITGIILALSNISFGQNYVLDYSDTTTFEVNCGKVIPSSWSVKEDSCELHTPQLETSNSDPSWMTYTVRINQSGNLGVEENAYIQHKVNDSAWITDTVLIGDGLDAVFNLTDSIYMDVGDVFQIRVIFETNAQTEFWQLKNGDIEVNNAVIASEEEPLPVELIYLNTVQKDKSVIIRWATASETNNDYFIVQRSLDASVFDSVTSVKGKVNSNTISEYEASDQPEFVGIIYYRLKQIDTDGHFKYSYIVSISNENNQEMVEWVSNGNNMSMIINTENSSNVTINIINTGTGQITNQVEYGLFQGNTSISLNELINQPGIYCVSSYINNKRHSKIIPFFN